jgi:hypothetical protein
MEQQLMTSWDQHERTEALISACEDMARLIKDAEIPEGLVRRCLSYEVAEFVYNGTEFWHR